MTDAARVQQLENEVNTLKYQMARVLRALDLPDDGGPATTGGTLGVDF